MINKLGMVEAYNEIKKLENKKQLLIGLYCQKYNITGTRTKEIIVSGGSKLVDAMLQKVIKHDDYITSIININLSIASWDEYLNQEISLRLAVDDITPVILFLKDYINLETGKFRNWKEVSKEVNYSERKCQELYYAYKNSLN